MFQWVLILELKSVNLWAWHLHIGLNHNDRLAVLRDSPKKVEDLKKEICSLFSEIGLRITIDANFLDMTLNLRDRTHMPHNKPGNNPLYISRNSNHPPAITADIPLVVNK